MKKKLLKMSELWCLSPKLDLKEAGFALAFRWESEKFCSFQSNFGHKMPKMDIFKTSSPSLNQDKARGTISFPLVFQSDRKVTFHFCGRKRLFQAQPFSTVLARRAIGWSSWKLFCSPISPVGEWV